MIQVITHLSLLKRNDMVLTVKPKVKSIRKENPIITDSIKSSSN